MSSILSGSTGYGHEDEGRIALDELFAELVRVRRRVLSPPVLSPPPPSSLSTLVRSSTLLQPSHPAAQVGAEAALVRPQFFSGTHTIACALYGALRPGDELLALAGHPYDTLEEVPTPPKRGHPLETKACRARAAPGRRLVLTAVPPPPHAPAGDWPARPQGRRVAR